MLLVAYICFLNYYFYITGRFADSHELSELGK